MDAPKPQKQHDWLRRLVGEWRYQVEIPAHEGHPASTLKGTETVRPLGDVWILAEGRGETPGGPATTLMTLGYDPASRRFVGSWIGSMMTYFWVYDGELDAAEKVLTLSARGPSMADDGTMADYQDVVEVIGPDHRVLRARMKQADGRWQQFMETHYHRAP